MYGFGGNDNLTGGSAGDFLIGGIGTDTLNGALGNDTYIFSSPPVPTLSTRPEAPTAFRSLRNGAALSSLNFSDDDINGTNGQL